jgi:predicted ferric reductase
VLSVDTLVTLEPLVTFDTAMLVLGGTAIGAAVAAVALPSLLPDLTASIIGDQPKVFWYLSRSAGVVAYLMLWLSAVLGLTMTSRLARIWPGGPAAADLHQFVSLLALALVTFHVVILLGDQYANYRAQELLVPFAATEDAPFWVGLGQVAAYLALPVTFSFYVRRAIGIRAWRLVHYTSFALLALTIAHGLGAGTDSRTAPLLAMYLVTGSSIVFLTTYRILIRVGQHG